MKIEKALISIIIPTYNRAHLIEDALIAIKNQTYTHWECIVVDDGSSDETEKIVTSYITKDARFQYHHRPNTLPKGANACRNYGYTVSKGQYINWLDSDDTISEDHFEHHLEIHKSQPLEASITTANCFDHETGKDVGLWAHAFPQKNALLEMIQEKVSWQTATVLWDKKIVPETPFDMRLQSSQEWMFHTSQLQRGITYKIVDKISVHIRRHDTRIGMDSSPQKYKSTFLSRYYCYMQLKKSAILKEGEAWLLHRMFQAIKGAGLKRYFVLLLTFYKGLLYILPTSRFKGRILKVLLLYIPSIFVFKKGERGFGVTKD